MYDAAEAHYCVNVRMNRSQLYEQNTQQEEWNPGRFDLKGLRQTTRLTKTFEVEMSRFTLPVAYFARIIDFRSYIMYLSGQHNLTIDQIL